MSFATRFLEARGELSPEAQPKKIAVQSAAKKS
jgi:hypothetical protein